MDASASFSPSVAAWWWFGELATNKIGAANTDGALSVYEILAPAGLSVPRHVHLREDEVFVILEGSAVFQVGSTISDAKSGDVLFGPRGVAHEYTVGPDGCRMLFGFTPGHNMESFIEASGVPALQLTIPPTDVVPPSPQVLMKILTDHGLAFA
jgi:quercetin dioxygenase-like cupin family protein